jgi:16S rRNA U516 pseudouridylate synthase RsuA-like enzyme
MRFWTRDRFTGAVTAEPRRKLAKIEHPTLRLIRWVVGPWMLDGRAPGQWRETEAPE